MVDRCHQKSQLKRSRKFDVEEMAYQAIEQARKRAAINNEAEILSIEEDPSTEKMLEAFNNKDETSITELQSGNDNDLTMPHISGVTAAVQSDDQEISEDTSSDEEESEDKTNLIRCNYQVSLSHNTSGSGKPISALALDNSGERMVAGTADCMVVIWDFQCLDPERPYRVLQPCGSHQIRQIDFGDRNDYFLVVSASAEAKVLDRSGKECVSTIKGDQYLVDMAKTKGHVSSLNGGQWNPSYREEFMTYGDDSTIRLWDVNRARFHHYSMIKVKPLPGVAGRRHSSVRSCVYSRCGNMLYAGADDGAMHIWDRRRSLLIPQSKIRSEKWDFISLSYGGNELATRSQEKIQLFDLRNFKRSVSEWMNETRWSSDLIFSPDDQFIVFGADHGIYCVNQKRAADTEGNNVPFLAWKCSNGPTLRIKWHPRIYQLFAGTHNGQIECMCDVSNHSRSQRGILLGLRNPKSTKQQSAVSKKEFYSNELVINPLALPMFRQEKIRNLSLARVRQRNAAAKSRRPELPITGAGENGRIGHHGSTLSSYIVKNIALQQVPSTKEDPRAELLKYSEEAEKHPYWVTPAYSKTQPKPIFKDDSSKPNRNDSSEGSDTG